MKKLIVLSKTSARNPGKTPGRAVHVFIGSMMFVSQNRLKKEFCSLLFCLLVGIVAQAQQPRDTKGIPFSDDPNLESTTASSSYVPGDPLHS